MKKAAVLFILILFTAFTSIPCRAEGIDTDMLPEALPSDTAAALEESGISPGGGIQSVGVLDIMEEIKKAVSENAGEPAAMFMSVTAVLLLSSLMKGLAETSGGSAAQVYSAVSALGASAVICGYMSAVISAAGTAFSAGADFMLIYVPVFAGVTAALGHVSSAAVSSALTVSVIQLLARAVSSVIIPLTSCMLGISAASAAGGEMRTDRLYEGIKKAAVWGLGLIMTVFTGLLTVQTSVASAADSAALKTARFAVSSSVPIVGGAVSEALSAVSGSLSVIRAGRGGYGIAAAVCLMLPVLVKVLLYRFSLFLLGLMSDVMGNTDVGRAVRAGESAMTMILACSACFPVFMTVSTAVLLNICRGGGA